ncbi:MULTISPECIES: FAD-linked oxidase C-terminal domain-containing protein [unclassified Mesorhizobium]|uniref:FAD-linked oxidase C-terminal domain-containing protein n=1 Tax=unclassified Mesorhizobium TaxID=325217 RepID=UPI001FE0AF2E|nr:MULTISPECIES: FAD-linked oxidase C-terminal domain-containing protein [unclassified Mesorhizobium]
MGLGEVCEVRAGCGDGRRLSAEHGVGLEKREAYERYADPVKRDLARMVKGLIDPGNLMNPGKVVG